MEDVCEIYLSTQVYTDNTDNTDNTDYTDYTYTESYIHRISQVSMVSDMSWVQRCTGFTEVVIVSRAP